MEKKVIQPKKNGRIGKKEKRKKKEKQVFAPDGTMHLSVKMTSDIPKKRYSLGSIQLCHREKKH